MGRLGRWILAVTLLTCVLLGSMPASAICRIFEGTIVGLPPTTVLVDEKYLWFEVKGDPLILKHLNTPQTMQDDRYLLTWGEKMPSPPEIVLKIDEKLPTITTPCWHVTAAYHDWETLWVALAPIPRPRQTIYIGMPPHPCWDRAAEPFEGGVLRIDLRTMKVTRWTSAEGLPQSLVCKCRPGDELVFFPEDIMQGSRVCAIEKHDGVLSFITQNGSKVRYNPQTEQWSVVKNGEAAQLLDRYEDFKQPMQEFAHMRFGQLHAREAVPLLLDVLSRTPISMSTDIRDGAKIALIEIADPASVAPLLKLTGHADQRTAAYAREAYLRITTPFSEPVNGLAFRLLPPYQPVSAKENVYCQLEIRATATTPLLALLHIKDRIPGVDNPSLECRLIREGEAKETLCYPITNVNANFTKSQFAVDSVILSPLTPGIYHLKIRIHAAQAYAKSAEKSAGNSDHYWYGEATANEVTFEVIPPVPAK